VIALMERPNVNVGRRFRFAVRTLIRNTPSRTIRYALSQSSTVDASHSMSVNQFGVAVLCRELSRDYFQKLKPPDVDTSARVQQI